MKNGSVYYAVSRYPDFGQFSHLTLGEISAVTKEHGNRPEDPNKLDPLDFVLWQAQAPGEPAWKSPWGLVYNGIEVTITTMPRHPCAML